MPAETIQLRSSSFVQGATYDRDAQELVLEFSDGKRFKYNGVPRGTYMGLSTASSPGKYFHAAIKDRFDFEEA